MEVEPHIVFEGLEPGDTIRRRIHSEIERLETFFGHVTSARVMVRAPNKRKAHGNLYEVSVHLSLPDGREVNANRNPPKDHAHEDVMVAIRDAFDAAQRQLQDKARKLRHDVKHHEAPAIATVKLLEAEGDYGFLETADGSDIYFHRNAVLDGGFDKLVAGDRVTYVAELGEKGLQASTVHILGKHGML